MGAQCAQSPTSRCTLGWIEEAAEGVEGVTEENSTDDPEVVDLRDTPQEMSCSCSVLVETLPANHHYEALPRTRTEIPRVSEDPVLSRKRTEGRSSSVEVCGRHFADIPHLVMFGTRPSHPSRRRKFAYCDLCLSRGRR